MSIYAGSSASNITASYHATPAPINGQTVKIVPAVTGTGTFTTTIIAVGY